MTKRPRGNPHRTTPLDRDGDGRSGGSLPGNQTAPMLIGVPIPPATTPAEQVEQDRLELDIENANDVSRQEAGWTRDNDRLLVKLDTIGARVDGGDIAQGVAVGAWSDQEAFLVETFANAMAADGAFINDHGDHCNADGSLIELPYLLNDWEVDFRTDTINDTAIAAIAEAEPDLVETTLQDAADAAEDTEATFTPDEIAASEGHAVFLDPDHQPLATSEPGLVIPEGDRVIEAQTATLPVAVRLADLRRLVDNRFLYKTAHGYSPNFHPPYVDQASIDAMIGAGLAEDTPSAGREGGVRVTPEARSLVNRGRVAS